MHNSKALFIVILSRNSLRKLILCNFVVLIQISNWTSWDELSSHQAEAVSLKLSPSYGYITTNNNEKGEWGAIIAKVGFNLRFEAISGNLEHFWFLSFAPKFLGAPEGEGCTNFKCHFYNFSGHIRQFGKHLIFI